MPADKKFQEKHIDIKLSGIIALTAELQRVTNLIEAARQHPQSAEKLPKLTARREALLFALNVLELPY